MRKAGWGTTHLSKYEETCTKFLNFWTIILVINQLDVKNLVF